METQAPQNLEVPKVVRVTVRNGIICGDLSPMWMHLHGTMNDRNNLDALKALAKAHGYDVEEVQ